jgi:hypothetical protein
LRSFEFSSAIRSDGQVQTSLLLLAATLGAEGAELAEGFRAVDGVSPVDVVKTFTNKTVDFLRRVFLPEIPRHHIVIDGSIEKLTGIGNAHSPAMSVSNSGFRLTFIAT